MQAELPPCEARVPASYMAKENPEQNLWHPDGYEDDSEVDMYLVGARSICAYRNMVVWQKPEDDCYAAYMTEEDLQTALDIVRREYAVI